LARHARWLHVPRRHSLLRKLLLLTWQWLSHLGILPHRWLLLLPHHVRGLLSKTTMLRRLAALHRRHTSRRLHSLRWPGWGTHWTHLG
jgi:hypothetical protein